jgi:hypothetical protein
MDHGCRCRVDQMGVVESDDERLVWPAREYPGRASHQSGRLALIICVLGQDVRDGRQRHA